MEEKSMNDTEMTEAVENIRKARLAFDEASAALIASCNPLYIAYQEGQAQLSDVCETFRGLQYHASKERRKDVGVIRALNIRSGRYVFRPPGPTTDISWAEEIKACIVDSRQQILKVEGQISKIRAITSLWKGYIEPSVSTYWTKPASK